MNPPLSLSLGLMRGLDSREYHADLSVSRGMLNDLDRSPAHCYALHHAPDRPIIESTAAMLAGTLLHTLVLEPDAVFQRYVVKPDDCDYRTKDGKAWRVLDGELRSGDGF